MAVVMDDQGSSGASTDILQQVAAQNGITLGGGLVGGPQDQPLFVYTGSITSKIPGMFPAGMENRPTVRNDTAAPVDELQSRFENSGDKNIRQMALALALAGYAGVTLDNAAAAAKDASLNEVLDWHKKFMQGVAEKYTLHHVKVTPEEYLRRQLEYRLGKKWDGKPGSLAALAAGADSGGGLKNGTFTETTKNTDILSPIDARSMVRSLLQQELGRDPTKAEYEDFLSAANTIQQQNPTISTTSTTYQDGMPTNSNTSSTGGVSVEGIQQGLYEKLKKQPSWAEWQAVGTYAPALFAALGAPVAGA